MFLGPCCWKEPGLPYFVEATGFGVFLVDTASQPANAGLFYGEGEQIFADVFKDAWRGVQSHAIVSPGVNKVPTVSRLP